MPDELYRLRQRRSRKARNRFLVQCVLFLVCLAGIAGSVWFAADRLERGKASKADGGIKKRLDPR